MKKISLTEAARIASGYYMQPPDVPIQFDSNIDTVSTGPKAELEEEKMNSEEDYCGGHCGRCDETHESWERRNNELLSLLRHIALDKGLNDVIQGIGDYPDWWHDLQATVMMEGNL